MNTWFEVDRQGLGKLMGRRRVEFMLYELVQNAWDQKVNRVAISISPVAGRPLADLIVEDDDPSGFTDMRHAFTLFAESEKKGNAEKRGRFNLGEKLVLAMCEWAEVVSTREAIRFDDTGRRPLRKRTQKGTRFTARFRCRRTEIEEIIAAARRLLVPAKVTTTLNGEVLPTRASLAISSASLLTEFANTQGIMHRCVRQTTVAFYLPRIGEEPWIYEMGIPICPHGGKYHYDVGQKVPMGMERDSVRVSYLSKLHALAFNCLYKELSKEEVTFEWIKTATESDEALPAAMTHYMELAFGHKRVSYDLSDPEANKIAVSDGYTIVHGGMLGKQAWANVKTAQAILPAGKVTPSPKPYSPDGEPLNHVPRSEWTAGMIAVAAFAKKLARVLIDRTILVCWVREPGWSVLATFGPESPLVLNAATIRPANLLPQDEMFSEGIISLLIHEFAHQYESDHLSRNYYRNLTQLGARTGRAAALSPSLLRYT